MNVINKFCVAVTLIFASICLGFSGPTNNPAPATTTVVVDSGGNVLNTNLVINFPNGISLGGTPLIGGTATNLDKFATNQVKTLALQVADPVGAATLASNAVNATSSSTWALFTNNANSGTLSNYITKVQATNLVTASTNGLATTNYVNGITNGLVTAAITNGLGSAAFTASTAYDSAGAATAATNTASLVRTNSTGVNLSGTFTGNGGGLTNLAYANLVGAPVIPSTNGFVTAAVTNGLATTNIVNSAILTLQSNLTVPASKTNSGLATITNVFAAAQNIGTPLTMANGGLPKLGFDSWPSAGASVSFSSVTNFMMQWTNCGMNLHGWKTCIIDDGWCMGHTNIGGNWYPLVNASRFPSASEPGGGGFSPLVNFLTNSGLAFGLYTENGTNTSANYVGSFGYEISDVTYYATNWGCKWLRFDGQPDTYEDSLVSYALKQLNSDIWLQSGTPTSPWPYPIYVFSGMVHSVKTNPYGDSISWPQCVSNILAQLQYGWQQRPGFLTEDMNTDFMQYTNQYQELALWGIEAMLSQSMQLGWVSEDSRGVGYYKPYINSDLLAIDQDAKCIPATVALVTNGCMVFVKPLGQAGPLQDYEVGIWNTNTFNLTNFTFSLASVGIPYSVVTVRDSWIQATELYATNNVTVTPWNVQQDHYTGHDLTNLVSQSLCLLRISPGVRTPFAIGTNNLTVINWLDATNNQGSYGNMVGCNRDYFGYLRPFATNYSHTVTGVAVTNNFIEFQDWGSVTYFIGSQPTNFTCEVALTDGSSISGGESFWVYTNGVLAASNSVANPSGGTGTTNFFNLALAGVNTLTITATHTNGPGNASAMIINPQVVCGYETIPNAGEPGYVSYNYSVSGSALPAQNLTGTLPQSTLPGAVVTNNAAGLTLAGTYYGNGSGLTNLNAGSLTGTLPTLYLTNSGNTGFVVTNVTASGVGLGSSYIFGTNGVLYSKSSGIGTTFCSSYYDSSGATAISLTSSAGGYEKITGCSGLMASNLVAINTITATNGYISSPITGNTSDLFAGYSTNGTKIFQVDSNGVVNGNGAGLTNLQAGSLTGTLPINSIPAGAILTGTTNNDASLLGTENVGAAGWSYDASWSGSYSAGWQHQTNSATGLIWTNNLSSGKYQVTWTVTNRTNGTFSLVWFGQSAGAALSASGAYGPTIPGGSTNLFITPTTNFDGTIAVSVKKITAGSQPMLTLFDSTSTDRFELRENNVFGNTFVGLNAGLYSTTGSYNTANGQNASYYNTTGSYNTANGQAALYSNTTGSYNTANGQNASYYNTTGSYNTANGQYALVYNTTGSYNTANGQNALRYLSDGSTSATNLNNTIALGDNVRALANGESYSITIGSGAQSLGSSNTVIGTIQTSRTTIFGVVCATNGYTSSPITGSTSDLFAGYSTNGTKIFQVDSNGVVNGNGAGLTNLQPSNLTGNQGRVVITSGPNISLSTGANYSPLGYLNPTTGFGTAGISGFAGSCSNFCFSENSLGATNIGVYIGTNQAVNSETYIGTIFPTGAGYNYTNWATAFYNNNPTNQIFLVLSNWSATTTVQARLQLTFTY